MKTGGVADKIIEVTTQSQMIDVVKTCKAQRKRYFILGGGSNTLFTDSGFRGVIILNRMKAYSVDPTSLQLTAESGCPMNLLVNHVSRLGLSGIEWYLGLPGTLGGAIYNNSHFKDHLIADVIDTVTILDETNHIATLPVTQIEAAYDYSRFQHTSEVILSAVINLIPDNPQTVMDRAKQAMAFRSSHQPLSMPSSGSFFKNPPNAPTAGALIDQAGLKNTQVGGALISPKHANFIVNTGSASTADIHELATKVQSEVKQKFNVDLQKEVFFINEFGERI